MAERDDEHHNVAYWGTAAAYGERRICGGAFGGMRRADGGSMGHRGGRCWVALLAALASACGDDEPASADATDTTSGDPPGTSGPGESSGGDASSSDPGGTTTDPGDTSGGGTTSATDASSSEDSTTAVSSSSGDEDDDDESTDASTTRDDESSSTGEPVDTCGDGVIDAGELCDGAALPGDTCESLGFLDGDLACDPTCDAFDTSECVANGGGDCCLANGEPGCEDDTCTTDVCYAEQGCCA